MSWQTDRLNLNSLIMKNLIDKMWKIYWTFIWMRINFIDRKWKREWQPWRSSNASNNSEETTTKEAFNRRVQCWRRGNKLINQYSHHCMQINVKEILKSIRNKNTHEKPRKNVMFVYFENRMLIMSDKIRLLMVTR